MFLSLVLLGAMFRHSQMVHKMMNNHSNRHITLEMANVDSNGCRLARLVGRSQAIPSALYSDQAIPVPIPPRFWIRIQRLNFIVLV